MRALMVVAHPDDETVGAGALLAGIAQLTLVHVTDGAPRDPWFWHAAGVDSRERYAALRAGELERALLVGNVHARRVALGCVDQEAALELGRITRAVAALVDDERPGLILTHPYEGGHPDHDACAFAVATALRLCRARAPLVGEMAFYHDAGGTLRTGAFLGGGGVLHRLDDDELGRKRAMLDCFASQRQVLARFSDDVERLRAAPPYDFLQPPHAPPLHYERFGWPLDGARFRALAAAALDELGLTRSAADAAPRSE
jgi:LmbE family N-acetylglucosaminyl deacetylase